MVKREPRLVPLLMSELAVCACGFHGCMGPLLSILSRGRSNVVKIESDGVSTCGQRGLSCGAVPLGSAEGYRWPAPVGAISHLLDSETIFTFTFIMFIKRTFQFSIAKSRFSIIIIARNYGNSSTFL